MSNSTTLHVGLVKLLDGLQDLLERRKHFVNLLLALRSGASGQLLGNARFCEQYSGRAFDIGARIKLDWSGNAKGSRKTIRDTQRKRATAKKEKAIASSAAQAPGQGASQSGIPSATQPCFERTCTGAFAIS